MLIFFTALGLHGISGSNAPHCSSLGKEVTLTWQEEQSNVNQEFLSHHKKGLRRQFNRTAFFSTLRGVYEDIVQTFSIHMKANRTIAACARVLGLVITQ